MLLAETAKTTVSWIRPSALAGGGFCAERPIHSCLRRVRQKLNTNNVVRKIGGDTNA